jgi:hypothetical protein
LGGLIDLSRSEPSGNGALVDADVSESKAEKVMVAKLQVARRIGFRSVFY